MFSALWARLKPSRRRVSVYMAVFLGTLVLRASLDVWAGYQLRAVSARIAPTYGGRLDAASLSPPAVAPGENRARLVSAAAALTDVSREPLRRDRFTQALLGAAPAEPEARLAILRQAVADNRLALQVLDEIESRPKANFEIVYEDGHRARMPSLLAIRDLGNLVSAAGRVAVAEGNADEAVRRARLGLTLAGSLAQEPNLLIQLIHLAVGREQLRLIRDVLDAADPSAAALESLAGRIEEVRASDPVVTGLIGELKVMNSTLGGLGGGATPWDPRQEAGGFWSRALVWFLRPAVRVGHARALDDLDRTITFARLEPYEREARKLLLPVDEPQPWWWRKLSPMVLGGLERGVRSGDEQRAMLMLASTAVALRRCRLERGNYPERLDQLAPAFVLRAPIDPYTGRAPAYARSGAGVTLLVTPPPGTPDSIRTLLRWDIVR